MSDRPTEIVLHLGAHKTATTHLQRSIRRRVKALSAAGVHFHGPQQLRGPGLSLPERFGLSLPGAGRPHRGDPARALADLVPGGGRLVLSEENFAGHLQGRLGRVPTPLYPKAATRCGALSRAAGVGSVTVALALRNPSDFLTSAYSQLLIGGRRVPPTDFMARNPLMGIDWADLVARLAARPEVREVIVWRYEDYAPLFRTICTALLGPAGEVVVPMAGRVHRGLSRGAVAALLAGGGPDRDVAAIRDAHPIGPGNPALEVFSAEDHELSQEFYADQTARIAALPCVTLLRR